MHASVMKLQTSINPASTCDRWRIPRKLSRIHLAPPTSCCSSGTWMGLDRSHVADLLPVPSTRSSWGTSRTMWTISNCTRRSRSATSPARRPRVCAQHCGCCSSKSVDPTSIEQLGELLKDNRCCSLGKILHFWTGSFNRLWSLRIFGVCRHTSVATW